MENVRITSFTSGKGGCGKTTLAVNFAYNIYQATGKVILIDFDLSNQGTSGLFRSIQGKQSDCLTLNMILGDELDESTELNPLLEIEPGFYVIPAISREELIWSEHGENLENLVLRIKHNIERIAKSKGVEAVVCDCFCGIDLLTTASAGVSSNTIIVNEQDIVTFNGSVFLFNHLVNAYRNSAIKPEINFVVNRVKGKSVKLLSYLYSSNLDKLVSSAVLTYFPYNGKIFDHFGSFPFFIKIVPGSLFAKKIDLLCYFLFQKDNPNFLKKSVQQWSKKKINKLYYRSHDYSSIDTGKMVLLITSAPVIIGLLYLCYELTRLSISNPVLFWFSTATLIAIGSFILADRITKIMYFFTRYNFSVFALRRKLRKAHLKGAKKYSLLDTILPLFGGVFSFLSSILLVGVFASAMVFSYDMLVNIKEISIHSSYETIEKVGLKNLKIHPVVNLKFWDKAVQKTIDLALYSNVRKIKVRDATVFNLRIGHGITSDAEKAKSGEFMLAENVEFRNCVMKPDVLIMNKLSNIKIMNCMLSTSEYWDSWLELTSRRNEFFLNANETEFNQVKMNDIDGRAGIIIDACTINGLELDIYPGKYVILQNCDITDSLKLDHYIYSKLNVYSFNTTGLEYVNSGIKVIELGPEDSKFLYELQKDVNSVWNNIMDFEEYHELYTSSSEKRNLIERLILLQNNYGYNLADSLLLNEGIPPNWGNQGKLLVMKVQLEILRNNSLENKEKALNNLLSWIDEHQSDFPDLLDTQWGFKMFNKMIAYNAANISMQQMVQLYAIEKAAFGELSPDELKSTFDSSVVDIPLIDRFNIAYKESLPILDTGVF